jgi:hypothetical protein
MTKNGEHHGRSARNELGGNDNIYRGLYVTAIAHPKPEAWGAIESDPTGGPGLDGDGLVIWQHYAL